MLSRPPSETLSGKLRMSLPRSHTDHMHKCCRISESDSTKLDQMEAAVCFMQNVNQATSERGYKQTEQRSSNGSNEDDDDDDDGSGAEPPLSGGYSQASGLGASKVPEAWPIVLAALGGSCAVRILLPLPSDMFVGLAGENGTCLCLSSYTCIMIRSACVEQAHLVKVSNTQQSCVL